MAEADVKQGFVMSTISNKDKTDSFRTSWIGSATLRVHISAEDLDNVGQGCKSDDKVDGCQCSVIARATWSLRVGAKSTIIGRLCMRNAAVFRRKSGNTNTFVTYLP